MSQVFHARRSGSGFTLAELLMALVIAVLLFTVVFTTYRTVSNVMAGQRERADGPESAQGALRLLHEDFSRAYLPEGDDLCGLTLAASDGGAATTSLTFCAAGSYRGMDESTFPPLLHIAYVLEGSGNDLRLGRATQPVTGPGASLPPVTNIIARKLASFRVELWDGSEWKGSWAPDTKQPPLAARVTLDIKTGGSGKPLATEILIPAGNTWTSSLLRTSTTPR